MSRTLAFRDFVPEDRTAFLSVRHSYESLADVLDRANEWIENAGVEVVHVETVLLPGSPSTKRGVSTQIEAAIGTMGVSTWFQVIRVWHYAGSSS